MLFTEGQFIDGDPITFPPMRMDLKKLGHRRGCRTHRGPLPVCRFSGFGGKKRDEKKLVAEPVSDFGRPLMKGS